MKRLRIAAQAVAICGVIAFMAWTKSRGITVVIPYFPHRRSYSVMLSWALSSLAAALILAK